MMTATDWERENLYLEQQHLLTTLHALQKMSFAVVKILQNLTSILQKHFSTCWYLVQNLVSVIQAQVHTSQVVLPFCHYIGS
jgi:hypothetical protein